MTSTPDNTARTWRDLADQLTPEQVAELEYCERENVPPGLASPENHLNAARMMSRRNILQALCADVAPPADAVDEPSEWEEWGDGYGRMYTAAQRRTGSTGYGLTRREYQWEVDIYGVQFDDGRIDRYISVSVDDGPMTAAQARTFAAALLEQADELDRLS